MGGRRTADTEPTVSVYYGPAGCGKSRRAYARYVKGGCYWATVNEHGKIWWSGYNGEKCVILDDFSGNLPFAFFLRLVDRYPLSVCEKGSTLELLASEWIITSNFHPSTWWRWVNDDGTERLHMPALVRRITEILQWRELRGGAGWVVEKIGF